MDKTIKFCVVGAGTASTVSILGLINALKIRKQSFQITCMHNPKQPTIQVGESTSTPVLALLNSVLNFRVLRDLPDLDGTLKYGTKYINWSDKDFFVHHTGPAIHLNSAKFSLWALDQFNKQYPESFNEIHDTVLDIKNENNRAVIYGISATYIYDYVIDCRGFPTAQELNSEAYVEPEFTSVNSVIIYPELKEYHELYTTSQAHKDGWMFGIPLTYRKAWGYLYNNNVTSNNEALENFKELKELTTEQIANTRQFSWTSFYRKIALDGRILYSGNKLYFFEPSQGFPLHYYLALADILVNEIFDSTDPQVGLNKFYQQHIADIQDVIAFTYQANVNFDSKFWNYAKNKSSLKLKNSSKFVNWVKTPTNYTHYASHSTEIMQYLTEGLQIDLSQYE